MESYLTGEMRTVVKDVKLKWRRVDRGVPQGSVLAPIFFSFYINDMPEGISSYTSLFADKIKLQRHIKKRDDC